MRSILPFVLAGALSACDIIRPEGRQQTTTLTTSLTHQQTRAAAEDWLAARSLRAHVVRARLRARREAAAANHRPRRADRRRVRDLLQRAGRDAGRDPGLDLRARGIGGPEPRRPGLAGGPPRRRRTRAGFDAATLANTLYPSAEWAGRSPRPASWPGRKVRTPRAVCWLTASGGDPRESATETQTAELPGNRWWQG